MINTEQVSDFTKIWMWMWAWFNLSDLEPVWHIGGVSVHWGALVSWLNSAASEWQRGDNSLDQEPLKTGKVSLSSPEQPLPAELQRCFCQRFLMMSVCEMMSQWGHLDDIVAWCSWSTHLSNVFPEVPSSLAKEVGADQLIRLERPLKVLQTQNDQTAQRHHGRLLMSACTEASWEILLAEWALYELDTGL